MGVMRRGNMGVPALGGVHLPLSSVADVAPEIGGLGEKVVRFGFREGACQLCGNSGVHVRGTVRGETGE